MKYRPEIDGLRAIAVISVILFHSEIGILNAGYLGVDVFFVISGYLITRIILSESLKGDFSFINFYDRRARRILPALYLVVFTSILFAWFFMSSGMMWDFWQSVISVPLFVSNILFTLENGYFELATNIKPLVHIWSLSVEEQFYLFFPIFLILLLKFSKKKTIFILVCIAIISLFLAHFNQHISLSFLPLNQTLLRLDSFGWASFYMPFGRAWELLAGSLIAFKKPISNNTTFHQIISFIGLTVIILSMMFLGSDIDSPSLYNLIPVIGTALVIVFATNDKGIGKLLSIKAITIIGLLSYSLYLWHQPVFAFYRMSSLQQITPASFFILLSIIFFLSWLSYKYVETPFRNKKNFSQKNIFLLSVIGGALLIMIGLFGLSDYGRNLHYSSIVSSIPKERLNMVIDMKEEGLIAGKQGAISSESFSTIKNNKIKILLLGDSQVGNWNRAIASNQYLINERFQIASINIDALCYKYLSNDGGIPNYCKASVIKIIESEAISTSDYIFLLESFDKDSVKQLEHLLLFLSNSTEKLTIVKSAEFTDLTKLSLQLAKDTEILDIFSSDIKQFLFDNKLKKTAQTHKEIDKIANESNIKTLSEYDFYCTNNECNLFSNNLRPFMYDSMHVTDVGANYLGNKIYSYLKDLNEK
jgi:peptidoglycan/LPS O-acetylase OafA/YrhL